jgi:hypothetical protein
MTTINFGDTARVADTDVIGEIVGLYRGRPPEQSGMRWLRRPSGDVIAVPLGQLERAPRYSYRG